MAFLGEYAMARQQLGKGLMLPVIRKVICRDDAYLCTICRSEYKSKVDANNCLNQCWFDIQDLYPVVLRKFELRRVAFRCHFCCRDYPDELEAMNCAQRCLNSRNTQHIQEQLVNDLPIEAPNRKASRVRLVAVKAQPQQTPSKFSNRPTFMPDANNAVDSSDATNESVPMELPIELAVVDNRRTKAVFPKQWIRADAKYQCKYCNKQYFTKMEVEGCFNGHFDEQDFELIPKT
jgi:hypothetical protein